MARARKQPTQPTTDFAPRGSATDASDGAGDDRADAQSASSADRENIERERATDLLVQLTGACVRDDIDAEDPRHDRLLAWMATEARAALSPAERAQLARDGEALLERVRARRGEAGGTGPPTRDA